MVLLSSGMRKTLGIIIVLIGVALVAFSLIIKCYMFGFSNIDGSEHITIYAYTLNERETSAQYMQKSTSPAWIT